MFCKHFTSFLFEVVQSSCLSKQDQKNQRGAYDRCFFVYRQMGLQPGELISEGGGGAYKQQSTLFTFLAKFFLLLSKSKQKREIWLVPQEILNTRPLSNKFLFLTSSNHIQYFGVWRIFFSIYPILENNRRFTVKLII